jgi:hypothetical protein
MDKWLVPAHGDANSLQDSTVDAGKIQHPWINGLMAYSCPLLPTLFKILRPMPAKFGSRGYIGVSCKI